MGKFDWEENDRGVDDSYNCDFGKLHLHCDLIYNDDEVYYACEVHSEDHDTLVFSRHFLKDDLCQEDNLHDAKYECECMVLHYVFTNNQEESNG